MVLFSFSIRFKRVLKHLERIPKMTNLNYSVVNRGMKWLAKDGYSTVVKSSKQRVLRAQDLLIARATFAELGKLHQNRLLVKILETEALQKAKSVIGRIQSQPLKSQSRITPGAVFLTSFGCANHDCKSPSGRRQAGWSYFCL